MNKTSTIKNYKREPFVVSINDRESLKFNFNPNLVTVVSKTTPQAAHASYLIPSSTNEATKKTTKRKISLTSTGINGIES